MTNNDFFYRADNEGIIYTILNYFNKEDLENIEDDNLRNAVLETMPHLEVIDSMMDKWFEGQDVERSRE